MSTPVLKPDKKGTYYAHWTDNRRSKRKSMGTASLAEAEARFAHWLLLRHDTQPIGSEVDFTVNDCWAVYKAKRLDTGAIVGVEIPTLNWKVLEPHFGNLLVPAVDQDAVDAYVAKRTTGQLGRKVKPQTCRKELQVLLAALRFCTKKPNRLFPASDIETIVLPEAGEPRDRWLRLEEVQRLLDAAARLRRGPKLSRGERFLWIALETAARKQAIFDLTWDRVDFDTGTIHFDVPGRRKTKKRRAAVSISRALRPILARAYEERENDLVMSNQGAIWATIQLIAIEAGFGGERQKLSRSQKPKATGISPHVLRHTAATHMARNGVPLWKVAKTLGNTLAMTEKVYAKWVPDDPEGTVDLISQGRLEAAE